MLKRLFDISFSLIALALFAMPSAFIAIVLFIKEKHKVFYFQARIGKDKRPFHIVKFQTMVDHVPTRTGRILRRAGVDEWPQFINVLKGEMSIVGPRALTAADIDRLGWNDQHHLCRWKVKPGITGFAQIYGGQHRKTSWLWDKHYLRRQNVVVDLIIICISFLMNVFGKTRIRKVVFHNKDLK